jgi:molybdate transport system regulatory protein
VKSTEVSLATGAADGLSIRNRIPGTVRTVEPGSVMTTVKVEIAGGDTLTAVITRESADELRLAAGDRVTALIKSTEMAVALA